MDSQTTSSEARLQGLAVGDLHVLDTLVRMHEGTFHWPGTHRRGFLDHSVHHPGAVGGCGVPVDPSEATWHTTDFAPGDALFFHAFTIHKALPNLSGDRLRLSTDNRYQRHGDTIDPGALLPHFNLT